MQLTVLADNNTFIDQYFVGEPALSFHIQEEGCSLLFDAGYSDVFIKNAEVLRIDLHALNHIVISHGHNDHTRGLRYLHAQGLARRATVLAHPLAFTPRRHEGLDIGSPLSVADIKAHHTLTLSRKPVQLSKRLFFLGEIPSQHPFEPRKRMGSMGTGAEEHDDLVMDDTALAYVGEKGLFIITGCSHSGICNIIEHAKKVCRTNTVHGVIGGLHLFEPGEQLDKTIQYFVQQEMTALYPCHCVSFAAKAAMNQHIPVQEVGVGLKLLLSA